MLLNNNLSIQKHVLSAYNISQENEKQFLVDSIQDGLNIFEKIFGFKSKSMIAPCYTWDFDVERISNQSGVLFIQGTRVQNHSVLCHSNSSFHYLGERNCLGQTYLIRNCVFEPSSTKKSNMYSCLSQIENAFNHQNPAIVSVHRQNFIGSLNEQNRENNLIQFQNLLKNIVNKYPDVIFMSSDELGEFISNNTIS